MYILGKHFETNYNKNSFENTPNQSLTTSILRIKYYPNAGMLLTNAPNYASI